MSFIFNLYDASKGNRLIVALTNFLFGRIHSYVTPNRAHNHLCSVIIALKQQAFRTTIRTRNRGFYSANVDL